MEKSASPISNASSKPEDERKAEETEILNGKPNKKIIKLSELTNMDPLEYFSRFLGIPEMIFRHLSSKDVLTASEVSPSYYNFIASSKVLMKKIEIVFDRDFDFNGKDLVRIPKSPTYHDHNYTTSSTDPMETKIGFHEKSATHMKNINLLKNSSRLYQNIKIRRWKVNIEDEIRNQREVGDYMTDSELDFFYSKAHEWKTVSLENVNFRKKLDLWRFLSAIESSVERIFVWNYSVLSFEDPSSETKSFEALKFPKLKKLTVLIEANSFGETLIRFLLNSVAIEDFFLNDYCEFDKDILLKMLTNFDNVKSLSLHSGKTDQIFEDESWEKFQFKLKSLAIEFTYNRTRDHVTNFLNFIKSQSDHLEELNITLYSEDRETFDIIMTLPKLECLTLSDFVAFSENEVPKKKSTSITDLTLLECVRGVTMKNLLDSMPNVTILALQSIDEEDFKMLKSMKRKFDILEVCELKGVDIKELEEIMTDDYISLEIMSSQFS